MMNLHAMLSVSHARKRSEERWFLLAHTVVFSFVVATLFRVLPMYTMQGFDGQYGYVFLTKACLWGDWWTPGTVYDPLEGQGGIFFPTGAHLNLVTLPFCVFHDPGRRCSCSWASRTSPPQHPTSCNR